MKAKDIINDIKWRINDFEDKIKYLRKQLETTSTSEAEEIKEEIAVKVSMKEALEIVLRGFNLID